MGTKLLMSLYQKKINELVRENKKLRSLCDRDFLTDCFNRRRFEEDLHRYIDITRRHNIKFSIIMIDINKFKEINDTRGHKTGDKVLQEVAFILKNNVRASDKVYRLGGDEFVLAISHYKSKKEIINRIRKKLSDINIFISLGDCDLKNQYARNVLENIDRKMYCEKRKNK